LRSSIATVTPPSTDVHTLVSGTATMTDPRVSPDGRYLAYQSSESGRLEVWVTEYPPKPTRRWRVSTAGGTLPRWGRDSRELFFVDQTGLMVASISGVLAHAVASRLWTTPGEQVLDYDIAPGGQRFLVILEKRSATIAPRLIVVRNWLEELRTRLTPSP
jgi:serine/threonine-protein kinase